MTYIVTTKRPLMQNSVSPVEELSRRPVATLEEAQQHLRDMWWRVSNSDMEKFKGWIRSLPSSATWTLPDGTVIEVTRDSPVPQSEQTEYPASGGDSS